MVTCHVAELKCGKMAIVSHNNRLDKDLVIGHMQGVFQLEIVPPPSSPPHVQCWEGGGHFVHEDNAEGVASMIIHFLSRHNL